MSKLKTVVHKYQGYDSSARRSVPDDDFIRHMAASILLRTTDDWIACIVLEAMEKEGAEPKRVRDYRSYNAGNSNFTEIRHFLRSDYGQTMCDLTALDAEIVLEKLEGWLRDYRERGVLPKGAIQKHALSGRRAT